MDQDIIKFFEYVISENNIDIDYFIFSQRNYDVVFRQNGMFQTIYANRERIQYKNQFQTNLNIHYKQMLVICIEKIVRIFLYVTAKKYESSIIYDAIYEVNVVRLEEQAIKSIQVLIIDLLNCEEPDIEAFTFQVVREKLEKLIEEKLTTKNISKKSEVQEDYKTMKEGLDSLNAYINIHTYLRSNKDDRDIGKKIEDFKLDENIDLYAKLFRNRLQVDKALTMTEYDNLIGFVDKLEYFEGTIYIGEETLSILEEIADIYAERYYGKYEKFDPTVRRVTSEFILKHRSINAKI